MFIQAYMFIDIFQKVHSTLLFRTTRLLGTGKYCKTRQNLRILYECIKKPLITGITEFHGWIFATKLIFAQNTCTNTITVFLTQRYVYISYMLYICSVNLSDPFSVYIWSTFRMRNGTTYT